MADRSAADRACKDPNPIIDGRKANVNLAYLGAKPRVMQPGKKTLQFHLRVYLFLQVLEDVEIGYQVIRLQINSNVGSLKGLKNILFCRFYLWCSTNSSCVHPEALWVRTS